MTYTKTFDPTKDRLDTPGKHEAALGDRRDGSVYVYAPEIILAVNVALAVGRPLLISGPPGSGKSSLAANVAR
jgi:MoxR-like ATPase